MASDERLASARLERERITVEAMIGLYCQAHHGASGALCEECEELARYAAHRLRRCPYRQEKPTCAKCPVHCYRPEMRARVREIMRYSGPRLLFRHPILTLRHLLDGRRSAPSLKNKRRTQDET